MKTTLRVSLAVLVAASLVACDRPNSAEEAGRKVDNAAANAGQKIDNATDRAAQKTEAATERAGAKMDAAANTAGAKMDQAGARIDAATDKAGAKMDQAGEKMEQQAKKAGAAIDDGTITAKVKSAFVAEPTLSALAIDVDTNKGVVTLNGTVGNTAASDRAKQIASGIDGVKSVNNRLVVKPAS